MDPSSQELSAGAEKSCLAARGFYDLSFEEGSRALRVVRAVVRRAAKRSRVGKKNEALRRNQAAGRREACRIVPGCRAELDEGVKLMALLRRALPAAAPSVEALDRAARVIEKENARDTSSLHAG